MTLDAADAAPIASDVSWAESLSFALGANKFPFMIHRILEKSGIEVQGGFPFHARVAREMSFPCAFHTCHDGRDANRNRHEPANRNRLNRSL